MCFILLKKSLLCLSYLKEKCISKDVFLQRVRPMSTWEKRFDGSRNDINVAIDQICEFTGDNIFQIQHIMVKYVKDLIFNFCLSYPKFLDGESNKNLRLYKIHIELLMKWENEILCNSVFFDI